MAKEKPHIVEGKECTALNSPYSIPLNTYQSKQNLVYFRKAAGYTQEGLAKKLGKSRSFYAGWESEAESKDDMPPNYLAVLAKNPKLQCRFDKPCLPVIV